MLSDRQVQAVVNQINADVNIPWVRESREEELIDKYVRRLNPHIGPAIESTCGLVYAKCIRLALCEETPLKERRREIAKLLQAELSEALATKLNEKVDASMLPESTEQKILKIAVDKIILEFVEWTIGEIDERIEESLAAENNT